MRTLIVNSQVAMILLFQLCVIQQALGQACQRPDTVFLAFNFNNTDNDLTFEMGDNSSKQYIFNYKERKRELFKTLEGKNQIPYSEVAKINFSSPKDLRILETEIMKCEINKGEKENSIYVDIDINSVFKNIIMVEKQGSIYFQHKVIWFDPIE